MTHVGCFTETSLTRTVATRKNYSRWQRDCLARSEILNILLLRTRLYLPISSVNFFAQKIAVIQNKLDDMAATVSPYSDKCVVDTPAVQPMNCFRVLNESEVQRPIMATPKKSCTLDPMPTPLVVGCIDSLLPVITKIINLSLHTSSFADQWKCALVHPLLKKLGLDLIFQSFRPVSNLQYISKLTEKAVLSQTHEYMVVNEIYPDMQSSYR